MSSIPINNPKEQSICELAKSLRRVHHDCRKGFNENFVPIDLDKMIGPLRTIYKQHHYISVALATLCDKLEMDSSSCGNETPASKKQKIALGETCDQRTTDGQETDLQLLAKPKAIRKHQISEEYKSFVKTSVFGVFKFPHGGSKGQLHEKQEAIKYGSPFCKECLEFFIGETTGILGVATWRAVQELTWNVFREHRHKVVLKIRDQLQQWRQENGIPKFVDMMKMRKDKTTTKLAWDRLFPACMPLHLWEDAILYKRVSGIVSVSTEAFVYFIIEDEYGDNPKMYQEQYNNNPRLKAWNSLAFARHKDLMQLVAADREKNPGPEVEFMDEKLHGKEDRRDLHPKEDHRELHPKEDHRELHPKEDHRELHPKEDQYDEYDQCDC